VGPKSGTRSGPLDAALDCQSPEDFATQSTERLKLAACQRVRLDEPGLYLVSVTVMVRGHPSVDRATLAIRVPPADAPAPEPALPSMRLIVSLALPAREVEMERRAELSDTFSEHGLLPQRRSFVRTVYQLAAGEEFVSATFRARSADNASAVQVAYVP